MFADLFKLFDCCFVITVCYLLCRDVKSSSVDCSCSRGFVCQVLRHIEYVQLLKSISWISPFYRMLYKDNVVYK